MKPLKKLQYIEQYSVVSQILINNSFQEGSLKFKFSNEYWESEAKGNFIERTQFQNTSTLKNTLDYNNHQQYQQYSIFQERLAMNTKTLDQSYLKQRKYHHYNKNYQTSKYERNLITGVIYSVEDEHIQIKKPQQDPNFCQYKQETAQKCQDYYFNGESGKTSVQGTSIYFNFSDLDQTIFQSYQNEYESISCKIIKATQTGA